MPLDPSLNVDGDPDSVKVSATDVAGSSECSFPCAENASVC